MSLAARKAIWLKLEYLLPSGSTKDRVAFDDVLTW